QEMPMLFVKREQRGPALLRILGTYQRLEPVGAIGLAREGLGELRERPVSVAGAYQVEPRNAAALRLALGERRKPTLDGFLHQHDEMPRQRAPRWRNRRILLGVDGGGRRIGFDDE